MAVTHSKHTRGAVYDQAAEFAKALEASQQAAADQMLAAWTDSYWATRQEIDSLLNKIAAATAAGEIPSPAWAYQQGRLKAILASTKEQIHHYAAFASEATEGAQKAAVAAAAANALKLTKGAVAESLPGFAATFSEVNPAVLTKAVGFLADGSVLKNHLLATMPEQAAEDVKAAIIKGLALGHSPAKMLQGITTGLALSHSRATTILRTESLRAYRSASRATYMANADVVGGWVWHANLDSRCCVACALMHGSVLPVDAVQDGHPRCRCAMVPRTKSWEELGVNGLEDTRPDIPSGKAWLENQPPHVQQAIMGPRKFDLWTKGEIELDDMVGRTYSPKWGTTRAERSIKAIQEGRNANYMDAGAPLPQPVPPPTPAPNMDVAKGLAKDYTPQNLADEIAADDGTNPQHLANVKAAQAYQNATHLEPIGPSLPPVDTAAVDKALGNLAKAVEDKGYPSKGYSQARAVWKARANAEVGSSVGPIKSLTWEQKINAQEILRLHDEALPQILADLEAKSAEALAQKAAEKAANRALVENAASDAKLSAHKAVQLADSPAAAGKALADQADEWFKAALGAPAGSLEEKVAKASLQQVQAAQEALEQATESMKSLEGTWAHASGAELYVGDDGWSVYVNAGGDSATTNPILAENMLKAGGGQNGWTHQLIPEPDAVKVYVKDMLNPQGQVDVKWYEATKELLADGATTPQTAADLAQALKEADAMKWAPEPQFVADLKATLYKNAENGLEQEALDDLAAKAASPQVKPLAKANLEQALQEYKAEKAAANTLTIPPAKPIIDPAKIAWEKASDAQVSKLIDKVGKGDLTMDDLYVAFQKSKNSGPKANYAKAILKLEGKGLTIPTQGIKVAASDVQWIEDAVNADALSIHQVAENAAKGDQASQAWIIDQVNDVKLGPSFLDEAGLDADNLPLFTKVDTAVPEIPTPTPPAPVLHAPKAPPWKPTDLKPTGKVLGTHGAEVWEAPDGSRWLFKPPKDAKDGFLVTLDEAASRLQSQVGLKAPDTFTVTLNGRRGSIQRMFDATDAFPSGLKATTLSEGDLAAVQHQQVLDWLLGNHDGHHQQFLRLPSGDLVGIDKGQAFRWFGQDRLDWEFHPNSAYGAPEPVYNTLWRAFAKGEGVELEAPTEGALAKAIKEVQAISDTDLRELFRPYAEEAAARGLLAKAQTYPGLVKGSIPANDVEAFLDALVQRKNDLTKDFQELYDRAAAARSKALPGWTKPEPKGAAKWLGKDKPLKPIAPEPPTAAAEAVFDDWTAKVAKKLKDFNGKDLETSNNWGRVQKVIQQRDRAAVQELFDRQYLDEALRDEALALIDKADAQVAKAEGAFKRAQAAHAKALDEYKSMVAEWKDANGIVDTTQGMEDAVIRHTSDQAGVSWAQKHFSESRYTATQRTWLKKYTGSSYRSWNAHLRDTLGKPTQYLDAVKHIDAAMDAQPIPEDVILHRGTGPEAFKINGRALGHGDDMTGLIGSVQEEHGWVSTSVGDSAAFSSQPVQLKIRAPAGTPGSYVQMFSSYGSERELILARGLNFYVHNAYKVNGRWFLEVEIVPADFDAALATPTPHTNPWSR